MDGTTSSPDGTVCKISAPEFFAETLRRLPLADSVLHVLKFALDEEFLQGCYNDHRGKGYEDVLSFPSVVSILSDALLVHHGSARQSLLAAESHGALPTCREAFYGKLRRLPLALSVAFMTKASQRLNDLLPITDNHLPVSLQGYEVRIIDGKKTKHIAKKLLPTRGQPGQLFGAKLLVAFDPATQLIQAVSAHADGEKNDAPLVPDLLDELRRHATTKPKINVADAQFCDLVQMTHYRNEGDSFVLRYHPKVYFHAVADIPRREFVDGKGRTLVEEYGWVGSLRDPRRCFVRRITWKRTDHKDLSIVTNLTNRADGAPDKKTEPIPASDLIDLYLTRWKIETVFQDVTETFGLRKFIGSTPEATAFQSAFCMVVYNAIMTVKSYVAASQPEPMPVDNVSNKMLFTSIHKQMTTITELVPPESLTNLIEPLGTPDSVRVFLKKRLEGLWTHAWKTARNKRPRRYGEKKKGSGAHTSVYRLLKKHREKQPAKETS
jgi:hypothetical protein